MMIEQIKRLMELRAEYPFSGYVIIASLTISILIGLLKASEGLWLPLIVAIILFVFFCFILVVFSNAAKNDVKGFYFYLSAIVLSATSLFFLIWTGLLTLASVGIICIVFLSSECSANGNGSGKVTIGSNSKCNVVDTNGNVTIDC